MCFADWLSIMQRRAPLLLCLLPCLLPTSFFISIYGKSTNAKNLNLQMIGDETSTFTHEMDETSYH
jgi:hypothetical protein